MSAPAKLLLASSNAGKLAEFRELATDIELQLHPSYTSLPAFEESAPTFAENAAGKAMHYSRHADLPVLADDSGLAVAALGGAPGVYSARYAGPGASNADRIEKLLGEMRGKPADEREARFICVLAVAQHGRVLAVVSDSVSGTLLREPRGAGGFGYDPIFYLPESKKTFAELGRAEKNQWSHRGKAYRRLAADLAAGTF